MAVAHDAESESHTGTTGSQNEASFSWLHTPTGTPRSAVVLVFGLSDAVDLAGTVTYGGVTVPAMSGGFAQDTATEPLFCKAYQLGASIPTGAQTVVVNRTNTADVLYAVCMTQTAATDTEYAGVLIEENNQTLTEENIDDGTPGTNSVRYCGVASGLETLPAAGANSTLIHAIDIGATCARVVRETTAGQGARPVGFSSGTGDDVAAVYFAIREIAAGGGSTVMRRTRSVLGTRIGSRGIGAP